MLQCAVHLCIVNAASWGLIPSVISQHNSQVGAAREGILSRVQGDDVFQDIISFGRLKYYFIFKLHFTNRNFLRQTCVMCKQERTFNYENTL